MYRPAMDLAGVGSAHPAGLPVGVQLCGRAGADYEVLSLAKWLHTSSVLTRASAPRAEMIPAAGKGHRKHSIDPICLLQVLYQGMEASSLDLTLGV